MRRETRSAATVRERRQRIVSILEGHDKPMTQQQIYEALQTTPNSTGYSTVGKDLRAMNEERNGERIIHRARRNQYAAREVAWSLWAHHPDAPITPYVPPSNLGKVLVFELPTIADPAPVRKVWVCHHKLRRGECAMCATKSGETK